MLSEGSVVEPDPRAEIRLLPGAEAEIMNCGSGSFLFTTDLKTFYRKKIMAAEEVSVNCYIFYPITLVKKVIFKVSYKTIWSWGRSRSWSRKRNSDLRLRRAPEPKPK